ncbi:MAG: hypothetical protein M3N49_01755, partial [Candidatus Eremiobacteraeota bacterium]|nr:hypothetical protein [Candidatus Eremiobacteraeota bacterium]
ALAVAASAAAMTLDRVTLIPVLRSRWAQLQPSASPKVVPQRTNPPRWVDNAQELKHLHP